MRYAASSLLVLAGMLAAAACSAAARTINVYAYSQLNSPSRASIGGSVRVGYRTPGRPAVSGPVAPSSGTPAPGTPSTGSSGGSSVINALLRDVGGVPCAAPAGVGTCYRIAAPRGRGPGAGRRSTPIDPRVLAAAVAQRLALAPGQIVASPSSRTDGLTGAPSWFWLAPAPTTESLTVTGGGERVTVTAVPSRVLWTFGDGGQFDGGTGHPYAKRAARAGSIQHVYRTRCLPGDQDHDPYVLSSCTAVGYQVGAGVEWTIGFQAAGPIATGGGLPPRTTSTGIAYPVDEVRSVLTSGGAGR